MRTIRKTPAVSRSRAIEIAMNHNIVSRSIAESYTDCELKEVLNNSNLKQIFNTMKYAGIITGILATSAVASLAILSTIHCTFGVAVIFAIMAIASAYLTYCEIKEIE